MDNQENQDKKLYSQEEVLQQIMGSENCNCRKKHRDETESGDLIRRLNRIEGQIRGIRGMVEKDAYCTDILTQVSAAQAALNSFSKELLGSHIRTCVVRDIQNGNLEVLDDLMNTIQKMMK